MTMSHRDLRFPLFSALVVVFLAGSVALAFWQEAPSLPAIGAHLDTLLVLVVAVVAALVLTGFLSARAGGTSHSRSILRNVAGGLLAMGVTYWIGRLVGHTLG